MGASSVMSMRCLGLSGGAIFEGWLGGVNFRRVGFVLRPARGAGLPRLKFVLRRRAAGAVWWGFDAETGRGGFVLRRRGPCWGVRLSARIGCLLLEGGLVRARGALGRNAPLKS